MKVEERLLALKCALSNLGISKEAAMISLMTKTSAGPAPLPDKIIKDLSILALMGVKEYIAGDSDSEVIVYKMVDLKSFSGKEVKVILWIEMTNNRDDQSFVIASPEDIGQPDLTGPIGIIRLYMPITEIRKAMQGFPADEFDNEIFWKFHRVISHEITHALDELHSEDSPSYGKMQELLSADDTDQTSNFYYTTREEVKAYISEILSELKGMFGPEDIADMSFMDIIKSSDSYNIYMEELAHKPGDEDIKTIGGSLARRKSDASKKVNSALYKWYEDQRMASN